MKSFFIQNREIKPGEKATLKLDVGRLPSHIPIQMTANVYRSKNPGPTMLVLGGVHGDEINGVEIVRRTIAQGFFENLKSGSVIAIPVLNIYGFNNFSREVPDGKDVNRSFPGSSTGSLASRVARILSKNIIPLIDFGADFHTGGHSHFNYPQIRYTKDDAESRELAEAFGTPYTLANKPIPKTLRKVAFDLGKPILTYEGGENLRFDGFSIEKGLAGIKRLMLHKGLVDKAPKSEKSLHFTKSTWIRANRAGIFRWTKNSGHKVRKGEPIGVINDPYGQEEISVIAKFDGYIIGHNNVPVVSMGDALFHIATA